MKKPQCLVELKNKIEQPKTQENVTVCTLVAGIIAPFALALSLMIVPTFPLRDDLNSAGILGYAIAFFGALAVAFIAALTIRQTNKRIQTYSWRRDQALKDVNEIFMPLFKEVRLMVLATERLEDVNWPKGEWYEIKDSYLGTKLRIIEPKLYVGLENLLNSRPKFLVELPKSIKGVQEIAREVISSLIDKNLEADIIRLVLNDMPEALDSNNKIYRGFIKGKSVKQWSLTFAENMENDQDFLVREALTNLMGQLFWQHQKFTQEEIERILDDIYERVQGDVDIQPFACWCNEINKEAVLIKKILEKRILVYVVSESGTTGAFEVTDTLEAIALLPGGPIIVPSYL